MAYFVYCLQCSNSRVRGGAGGPYSLFRIPPRFGADCGQAATIIAAQRTPVHRVAARNGGLGERNQRLDFCFRPRRCGCSWRGDKPPEQA